MPSETYSFEQWQGGELPPHSWDVADAVRDGWTGRDIETFLRTVAVSWSPPADASGPDRAPRQVEPPADTEPAPIDMPPEPPPHDDVPLPAEPFDAGSTVEPEPEADHKPEPPRATDTGDIRSLDNNGRPEAFVQKGHMHELIDRCMSVLSGPDVGIYARGDELVRAVSHRKKTQTLTVRQQAGNVRRDDGATVITALSEPALTEALTRRIWFKKWDGRAKDYVPCDTPPEIARTIIANKGHGWTVPRLRAVISAPTLRHDGTVLNEAGYDEATGLLLVGDQIWRGIPDAPTKQQAVDALDVLSEPIADLPFVDNSDRAAALALLITAVMRPALKTAPMFAVSAPAAGTGKSLTIDIAAIMATGRKAAVVTPTPDEAELEKRIGATALAGDQIISIDNVTHILRSDQLCQMLTQEEVLVRVLGASKNVRIPSTGLICATGNNLSIHGDLNRRTIRIRLDAKMERPDERSFPVDATELARRNRPELIAAALTIVRAYLTAGTPSPAKPMGSFEDWSDIVRSALIWLNMGDCRGDVAAMYAEDTEKAELAEIMEALPRIPFTVREISFKVQGDTDLREILEGFMNRNGGLATKKFGRYLARYAGTVVGGRKIEKISSISKGVTWQVVSESNDEAF